MLPTERLRKINKNFGNAAWRLVDTFRADKGKEDSPDWSNWCFLPFGGWYAIACFLLHKSNLDLADIAFMQELAAVGTWRPTQDVVRFDSTILESVRSTEINGKIPSDIFYRLPAWAVYVEVTMVVNTFVCDGFLVMLEEDANDKHPELRLFFSPVEDGVNLIPYVLYLGDWTVETALEKANETIRFNSGNDKLGFEMEQGLLEAINLTLYICANGLPETENDGQTAKSRPQAKKVKDGWRLFPPPKPTIHTVGLKIGEEIRKYQATNRPQSNGTHASPRPHIRRAHWHGYWHGPRGKQEFRLQWLPPIPVALKKEDSANGQN